MNETRPSDSGPNLSPRLRSVLDPGQRILSEQVALEMSQGEVDALRDLLEPGAHRSTDVSLPMAIGALAVRDRTDRTAASLGRFAGNRTESLVDRAIATAGLRLIPTTEARSSLARLVDASDMLVRLEAIKAMGCIGDVRSLETLDGLTTRPSGVESRQRDFARSLIAHRLGLSSDYLPFQPGIARRAGSPDEYVELSLRPLRARRIAEQVENFSGSDYGIAFSSRVGFALRAGRARWSVLANDGLGEGGAGFARSSIMFERPWITALLARVDERTGRSAPQYVVLSDPDESGARVMVMRTDGEQMYAGSLSRPGGMLRFVVRDVARRGTAPTHIKGSLTGRGVELDVSIPFGRRKDVGKGQSIFRA